MRIRFYQCLIFLAILAVLFGLTLVSPAEQYWVAPAEEAQKKNPVAADKSSLAAGEKIYLKRCASCHGKTGNGDGPDAVDLGIHPAKFSEPALRNESDGALFWKVTVGRKPMPDYGRKLSPNDRWNVINYLRTLSK